MRLLLRRLWRRTVEAVAPTSWESRVEDMWPLCEEPSAQEKLVALGLSAGSAEAWLSATSRTMLGSLPGGRMTADDYVVDAVTSLVRAEVPLPFLERLGYAVAAAGLSPGEITWEVKTDVPYVLALESGAPDVLRGNQPSCVSALDRLASEEYLAYLHAGWPSDYARGLIAVGMPQACAGPGPEDHLAGRLYSRWCDAVVTFDHDVQAVRRWAPVFAADESMSYLTAQAWDVRDPVRAPLLAASGLRLEEYDANPAGFADDDALAMVAALRRASAA